MTHLMRLMSALKEGCQNDEKCKQMTNQELADALKLQVWANMQLHCIDACLVAEAIDRLETLTTPTAKGG